MKGGPVTGQQTETFILGGGLDLVTPALAIPAGRCISVLNYEAEARGYRRMQGYERFDGRPAPSAADFLWLTFEAGFYGAAEGYTLTGATSGASGALLADAVATTGSFAASTAAGSIAVMDNGPNYQDGETLTITPSVILVGGEPLTVGGEIVTVAEASYFAVVDGTPVEAVAPTDDETETARIAAEDARRAVIAVVPGSGPVRGVWGYAGAIWAFRDNAGATAGKMFKATAAGWVEQSFGHTLDFDGGTGAAPGLLEGQAINGQSSGATATIQRVIRQSGSWGTNAAGYLVLSGVTGTFTDNENIRVGSTVYALANGTQAAITLPAGGRYEAVNHNFYGTSNLRRMYFVNGQGYAHEWDGTVLAPIRRGMTAALDKPTHVGVLANHLFQAYPGGAILFSGIGEPLLSGTDVGAGELGFGVDVTGLLDSASTSLVVFGRNKAAYIEGTDAETFVLKVVSDEAGAIENTVQMCQAPTYLDQIGIRKLETTQSYGNWQAGTLSRLIEPVFRNYRRLGVGAACSLRVKSKDQYRVLYSDGSGVLVYFGRKTPELMLFKYLVTPFCACSTEEGPEAAEEIYIGASDGYVYRVDAGQNYDGEAITAAIRLPFNSLKSPTYLKRYIKATLEVDASASTEIFQTAEFAYADSNVPASPEQAFVVRGGGGFWDEANWDQFYWSAPTQGLAEAYIAGIGQNVSIAVLSETTHEDPHTLTAMTLNYSVRRQIR